MTGLFPLLALISVYVLCLVTPAAGWSTGSGTCIASETGVTTQTGRHPITNLLGFYLRLPLQYTPNTPYTLSVDNSGKNANITQFNGFLFYAHDSSNRRVGTWTEVTGVATTDMTNAVEATRTTSGQFACDSADKATLTHATGGAKKLGTTFVWTAPSTNVGKITFVGLVEWSNQLYYTQVLTPWQVCQSDDQTCRAFDPSTLPSGPLPLPPTSGASPFGLQEVDPTACGSFTPLPNAVVPPGFCASLLTDPTVVNRPRGIYVTDRGDLLVLESGNPTGVSVLRDMNGDGKISRDEYTRIFTQPGLNHGLYVREGWMYVSSPTTVWRLKFDSRNPARVMTAADATVVVKGIPGGGHTTRTPLVSHDGQWLYVSVGSAGNLDADDSRSRVNRYDLTRDIPAGGWQWNAYSRGTVEAFARGLRNEVGLTLDLQGEVWGAMNADDQLNRPDLGGYAIHNDNPAERIDHLREENMEASWYGYPYCWAADILPKHENGEIFGWGGDGKDWYLGQYDDTWCRANTLTASYALEAHTAPLGLHFYDGRGAYGFPPEYFNQIFVAQHGSWNSDQPRGYKVTRIGTDPFGQPLANTSRDFLAYRGPGAISGAWPHKPADVKVGAAGELYISSPDSSHIIVVRYLNPPHHSITIPRARSSGYQYQTLGGPTKPVADFTFDRSPAPMSNAGFRWVQGDAIHAGLAYFDGEVMFINTTRADNGAGVASPNITGGSFTHAVWLNAMSLPTRAQAVIWEFSQPGEGNADGYMRLVLQPSGQLAFAHKASGQAEQVIASTTLRINQWWHVVVTVNDTRLGSLPITYCTVNATYVSPTGSGYSRSTTTQNLRQPIPLMHRRSGLLGRPYHLTDSTSYFHGTIDSFRMYPFAVSAAQTDLTFWMEAMGRTNPVLQANLHQQPPENAELANYTHQGPNNRYTPTPSTLFPGWASFNGRQGIDLTNPMSGVGVQWRDQLQGATTVSIELWVRLSPYQPTGGYIQGSILRASNIVDIFRARDGAATSLTFAVGGQSLVVNNVLRAGAWVHVVMACRAQCAVYVNGTSMGSVPVPIKGQAVTEARLGEAFVGDIAIFRVYDVLLDRTQVGYLFAAQMAEQGRTQMALRQDEDVDDDDDDVLMSVGGIIGLVLAITAVLTAVVVLVAWRSHRVKLQNGAAPVSAAADYGISLLIQ